MRTVSFCLASVLAFAMGNGPGFAADYRIDPDMARDAEMSIAMTGNGTRTRTDAVAVVAKGLPHEYASAMTWYRTALADGYTQPPLVASPWLRDEQLPEPLQWTWVADNGDVITRAGKGVFRLSLADNQNNWFKEVDCKLLAWPGGNSEASMSCEDGVERTMSIPGDGIVLVDDVQYVRVFDSDATSLPPEEAISVDELTAAAIQAAGLSANGSAAKSPDAEQPGPTAAAQGSPDLPDLAPIPRARQLPAKRTVEAQPAQPVKQQVRELPVEYQNCGVC